MKNYNLLKTKEIESMGIQVFLYQHIKTKASITYVKSKDKNKTFAIGFKTLPKNSKGCAHIMEHSVLNGSKKYRTKEPFMDMASSSLQTFLNAMTYPDKTVYPVSSENDKDFFNLTDVYLDAVFNPRVLEKEEIFLQEGWHYELEKDRLGISGVVYNEMKGALTNPDTIVYNDIIKHLYKNSPYEYISGGNPYEICKLSYKEFLDFYKTYYHPSNSRIYLYGDLDIDFYLAYIDKEYLSNYDYKPIDSNIEIVENYYDKVIETSYPSSVEDENLAYLSYSFLANSALDLKDYLTLNILSIVLFSLDSSEISKKVYSQIKPEAFFARIGYATRSSLIIQAQKANKDKLSDFVKIIEEGIEKAATNISKDALRAAFSIIDFSVREQMNSVSKGLEYFLMSSLYADELSTFDLIEVLDQLKSLIDTDYYEKFVEKYFLNNKTKLIMLSNPSKTYSEEKDKKQREQLDKFFLSLNENDLAQIKEKQEKFKQYQERKDSQKEKETIPKLDLSDVSTKVEKINRLVVNDKYEFIFHAYPTANIIYTSLFFDINDFKLDDLKYAQILSDFLGAVDTKYHNYGQIDNLIYTYMGSFDANVSTIRIKNKIDRNFKVSFKTTRDNLEKSLALIKEILLDSKLSSKTRLLELLKQRKTTFEMSMYDSGHILAMNRSLSHIDKLYFLKEEVNGISYYLFVKEIIKDIENDFDKFKSKLMRVMDKIFSQNISINVTCPKNYFSDIEREIKESFKDLKEKEKSTYDIEFKKAYKKEAILTDSNVNYVSMSANLNDFAIKYSAKLNLAAAIISNPYLYDLVRAKKGAYGVGMTINKDLNLAAYSYRDPNIMETIDSFSKIGQITESLELTDRDFINQKIGKIGSYLNPKTPNEKGAIDYLNYKKGIDEKETEKILEDIKDAKLSHIKAYHDVFQKAMNAKNLTVFGNRKQILENKAYFDTLLDLNK